MQGVGLPLSDFSDALRAIKAGATARNVAWKANKYIHLRPADSQSMSYLELVYTDGRRAPWTPTRCDLLDAVWLITVWQNPD